MLRKGERPSHYVFGTACNPPGLNHAAALSVLASRVEVERVYMVPTYRPPHKNEAWLAPFEHRLAMAELVVKEISPDLRDKVVVSDVERVLGEERGMASYTIATIEYLEACLGVEMISAAIGPDHAKREVFQTWHRHEHLLQRGVGVLQGRGDNLHQTDLMEGMHLVGEVGVKTRAGQAREVVASGRFDQLPDLVGWGVAAYLSEVGNVWADTR